MRRARAEARLSQAQLGAPHFTRAYISALELGKVRPAMKSLEFLAGKLGRPVSFFVEDEAKQRERQERELDIKAIGSLLSRATADKALERVQDLLSEDSPPAEIARLRLMAGIAYNFLARGDKALPELTVAERIALQLGDTALLRSARHQLAIAHRNLGSHKLAHDLLTALLSEIEIAPVVDQIFRMKVLKDLGAFAYDLGDPERASGYYLSALAWAKDIGDVSGLIDIYNGLACSYRALGDLEAATAYFQKALGATEVSNDLTAAAVMHNALAIVAAERGHMAAAYRHVDRAIEIARASGPEVYVPHYLNTKAECALKLDQKDEARALAEEARAAAERVGNHRAGAAARVVLAEASAESGDMDRWLREAADIYRDLDARSELGHVLMRLSKVAQSRGDSELARHYAEEAYRATRSPSGLIGGGE